MTVLLEDNVRRHSRAISSDEKNSDSLPSIMAKCLLPCLSQMHGYRTVIKCAPNPPARCSRLSEKTSRTVIRSYQSDSFQYNRSQGWKSSTGGHDCVPRDWHGQEVLWGPGKDGIVSAVVFLPISEKKHLICGSCW